MKQTLQDKQNERGRLNKAYRMAKREQWRELCQQEPRLIAFRRALRRQRDARAFLARLADSWLRSAHPDVRYAALREIGRHADNMARREGRAGLDDPIPPQRGVIHIAKELLAVR